MINEMMSMGNNCYRLYDSFVFLVEKTKIHVASEQVPSIGNSGPPLSVNMFELQDASIITYVFNDEAVGNYDTLLEEHAVDLNSQYLSDTRK